MSTRHKIGMWLLVLAYALLVLNAISTLIFVRQNAEHMHEHMDYVSSWSLSLLVAVTLLGIRVCIIPLRRGEVWAWIASLMTWVVIAVPRLVNDPRCLQLDLNRHGCHTFMATIVIAAAGLVLSRPPRNPATT
jgi:hypothetical protein